MDETADECAKAWRGAAGILELQERLTAWAIARADVRGLAFFGSLTRADKPGDDWSDVDALIVVDDGAEWRVDDGASWLAEIGPTWLQLLHPAPIPGLVVHQVLFEGGYDADLIVVEPGQFRAVADNPEVAGAVFGHGFHVALDRDGVFAEFAPADPGPDLQPPTADEFAFTVRTSLYQVVWAAKRLRRGETWRAVDDVDNYLKGHLLRLLEWQALATGREGVFPDGRRLEHWAAPDVLAAVPATWAAGEPAAIASALDAHLSLLIRLGAETADRLGFAWPSAAATAIAEWVQVRLAEVPRPGEDESRAPASSP